MLFSILHGGKKELIFVRILGVNFPLCNGPIIHITIWPNMAQLDRIFLGRTVRFG